MGSRTQQLNIRISKTTKAQLEALIAHYGESYGRVVARLVDRDAARLEWARGLESSKSGTFPPTPIEAPKVTLAEERQPSMSS